MNSFQHDRHIRISAGYELVGHHDYARGRATAAPSIPLRRPWPTPTLVWIGYGMDYLHGGRSPL
jgi:hypothetical protein